MAWMARVVVPKFPHHVMQANCDASVPCYLRVKGSASTTSWCLPIGGYSLLLCSETTSEERSAGNPYTMFCGNRRRMTTSTQCRKSASAASSDPISPAKQNPGDRIVMRVCIYL